MTLQLQTDKNLFQFHIIYLGMNPLRQDASTRTKEDIESIRHIYLHSAPKCSSSSHTRDRILWVGKSPESVRPTLGYRPLPCQNAGGHAHDTSRLSSETFVA